MRSSRIALGTALLLLAGCAATQVARAPEPPLSFTSFGTLRPSQVRTLVILVHDDAGPSSAIDYAAFGRRAAAAVPAGSAVLLVRPGFTDAAGAASPGMPPRGIGDGYSPDQVRLIGQSVEALRARYPKARTILVGDGGGAALAANLAASRPGLADSLLLVGCPCALPEWRQQMAKRDRAFAAEVDSLDPLQTVGGIAPGARVGIVSGGDTARVPARIARLYAEALALRGIAVEYRQIDADGAALLQSDDVIQLLARLAATVPQPDPRT